VVTLGFLSYGGREGEEGGRGGGDVSLNSRIISTAVKQVEWLKQFSTCLASVNSKSRAIKNRERERERKREGERSPAICPGAQVFLVQVTQVLDDRWGPPCPARNLSFLISSCI
jgi:hypothetical protein